MTVLHAVLGAAMVATNLAAAAWGTWRWWTVEPSRAFWVLLRAGQLLTAITALQGLVVNALGEPLPPLHLVYGLSPLAVSFVAEQLRLVSAQTVLDHRGVESSHAVKDLPAAEQRSLVLAIVRREMGVMAASAAVVAALGIRASGLL